MSQFDSEKYTMVFESKSQMDNAGNSLKFYAMKDASTYHLSRYIAASAQNVYSEVGISKPLLEQVCDEMIKAVNSNKITDVAVWANNLKARMKYPVDEHSALRMALIYHFVEGEDPNKCESHWTEWKLQKVLSDPEAYSFFLPIGLVFTPSYTEYLEEVSQSSLNQRKLTLEKLTPIHP